MDEDLEVTDTEINTASDSEDEQENDDETQKRTIPKSVLRNTSCR